MESAQGADFCNRGGIEPLLAPTARSVASVATLPKCVFPLLRGLHRSTSLPSSAALRPLLNAKEILRLLDNCCAAVELDRPLFTTWRCLNGLSRFMEAYGAKFKPTDTAIKEHRRCRQLQNEQMEAVSQQLTCLLQPFCKLEEQIVSNFAGVKVSLIECDASANVPATNVGAVQLCDDR